MIIQISGGGSGWGNYVMCGTVSKPRDPNRVKVLKGDINFGDKMVSSGKWKQNAYHLVLGFKGRISEEKAKKVLDDFEKQFMVGFDKSEYHMDAIMHTDTDDDHIHVRIPKMNLLTQTQLRLYYDKKDRPRLKLIRDFLDVKYNLESPLDNRQLVQESQELIIDEWREEQKQEPLDFKKKGSRDKAKKSILDSILRLHKVGTFDTREDITTWLENLGLSVKYGYDIPDDFYYVTVSNDTGKSRIKSELFDEKFWKLDRTKRTSLIETNLSHRAGKIEGENNLEVITAKLNKANTTRINYVKKTYSKARSIATKKNKEAFITEHKKQPKEGIKNAEPHRRTQSRVGDAREAEQNDVRELQKELATDYLKSIKNIKERRDEMGRELSNDAEYVAEAISSTEQDILNADGGTEEFLSALITSIGKVFNNWVSKIGSTIRGVIYEIDFEDTKDSYKLNDEKSNKKVKRHRQ
jgi:hypothetical protein